MTTAKIPPTKYEIMAAVGGRCGQRRKVVVLAGYTPPNFNAGQNKSFLRALNNIITAIKTKYVNPYVLVGGDFNRRDFRLVTREHPNIKQIITGPTRGNVVLDIQACNMHDLLIDCGTADGFS